MKLKIILIFAALMVIFGCGNQHQLSQKKKIELITIVDSLFEIDQRSRHKLSIPDSIYGLGEGTYMNLPQVLRDSLGVNYDNYRKKFDSLVALMKESDITNTEKLIEITEKYGFPSAKRLGVYKSKAYMIFVHSPKFFHPQIESLILEEYKEGRINEYEKEYIFWHIKGRKSLPPRAGKNGEEIWN